MEDDYQPVNVSATHLKKRYKVMLQAVRSYMPRLKKSLLKILKIPTT